MPIGVLHLLQKLHRLQCCSEKLQESKKAEIQELISAGVYIAGFTDSGVRSNEQLYDVYVDLPARSIQVAEHAKADFALGQIHKDFANFLVSASEGDDDQVA